MRLPTLMKINKHKRFNYTPRYYDPVKERVDEKIEEARRAQGVDGDDTQAGYSVRISEAFRRRERENRNMGSFRLMFLLAIIVVLATYVIYGSKNVMIAGVQFNYGDYAPYIFGIVIVAYIYFRVKKKR